VNLGIGLEIWLTGVENFVINSTQSPYSSGNRGWTIGLTKHDRSWCIAIREAYIDGSEMSLCNPEDNITPLLEAPRERRIASLKLIPALVARLNVEAKRAAKVMDEAIEQARVIESSLSDDDLPF
jgi:hypothetical protein